MQCRIAPADRPCTESNERHTKPLYMWPAAGPPVYLALQARVLLLSTIKPRTSFPALHPRRHRVGILQFAARAKQRTAFEASQGASASPCPAIGLCPQTLNKIVICSLCVHPRAIRVVMHGPARQCSAPQCPRRNVMQQQCQRQQCPLTARPLKVISCDTTRSCDITLLRSLQSAAQRTHRAPISGPSW